MIDSTPLLGNPEALRARVEEDGYLFLRQYLPGEPIFELRAQMLAVLEKFGWRSPGQGRLGGRIDLEAINRVADEDMREDIGVSVEAYHAVQRLQDLHALPHHPRLVALYQELFGESVLVHPRHIARMITGHCCMVPTPPHQDFPLIQGTARTWTCWFPVGDCPRDLGGLTVLRGSHRQGCLPVSSAKGAGGLAAQLCPDEKDWVEVDYGAGDILTFPSHTVHRALPCRDKSLVRLSLDVRYQPLSEPVEAKSLLPHCELPWEALYAGWTDTRFQYYWQQNKLNLSDWDDAHLQPGRRIC